MLTKLIIGMEKCGPVCDVLNEVHMCSRSRICVRVAGRVAVWCGVCVVPALLAMLWTRFAMLLSPSGPWYTP